MWTNKGRQWQTAKGGQYAQSLQQQRWHARKKKKKADNWWQAATSLPLNWLTVDYKLGFLLLLYQPANLKVEQQPGCRVFVAVAHSDRCERRCCEITFRTISSVIFQVKAVIVASSPFMLSVLHYTWFPAAMLSVLLLTYHAAEGSMWPIKCVHLVFSLDHMQIKKPYGPVSD